MVGIAYLFGHLPADRNGVPSYGSHATPYVIVEEDLPNPHETIVKRVQNVNNNWQLERRFRCHALTLTVTSNVSPARVRAVSRAILDTEACGK
ncbi:MAG: hypothetical protein ACRDFX_05925 [Chloroflexota bacterium]